MPFYAMNARFKELDPTRQYLLYCDKGVMSRLHAHHLLSEGHANVRLSTELSARGCLPVACVTGPPTPPSSCNGFHGRYC
jgi:rhodanese-related sulfurtransferase